MIRPLLLLAAFLSLPGAAFAAVTASAAEPPAPSLPAPPSEEMLRVRDPFKRPDIEIGEGTPKTELERYPIDGFKMVAVLTGPHKMRAMLQSSDGKTYIVSEKMKIGVRGGVIRRINAESIDVRERIVNILGQEENVDSQILLAGEPRRSEASNRQPLPGEGTNQEAPKQPRDRARPGQ